MLVWKKRLVLFVIFIVLLVAGCGQKGVLYLPDDDSKKKEIKNS